MRGSGGYWRTPCCRTLHRAEDTGESSRINKGDPALDTVIYDDLGGLRLDYVLPSSDLAVSGAGVLWPAPDDPLMPDLAAASHHFPVWVDITLP